MMKSLSSSALLLLALTLSGCADKMPVSETYYPVAQTIALDQVLPPYPPVDSEADRMDRAAFDSRAVPRDSVARQEAAADAAALKSDDIALRFADALGKTPTRDSMPRTLALLDKVGHDLNPIVDAAKHHYNRSRPIYRFAIKDFCDTHFRVQTEWGDSYPSGHAARGWSVGLVLAMLVPDRAPAILGRANSYGQNRVVCRVHYPSDVVAGQLLATAFIAQMKASPAFAADVAAAKAEWAR